ncbi:unnamed protein product [Mycena citricolor]|uniref:Uncharacterized protein n=1 Tax=Mycena citricolor TaxID=2018698 RepID=A0AAD2HIX5_9AGAR|nr:unnamed protein product [Mycena citricolor]
MDRTRCAAKIHHHFLSSALRGADGPGILGWINCGCVYRWGTRRVIRPARTEGRASTAQHNTRTLLLSLHAALTCSVAFLALPRLRKRMTALFLAHHPWPGAQSHPGCSRHRARVRARLDRGGSVCVHHHQDLLSDPPVGREQGAGAAEGARRGSRGVDPQQGGWRGEPVILRPEKGRLDVYQPAHANQSSSCTRAPRLPLATPGRVPRPFAEPVLPLPGAGLELRLGLPGRGHLASAAPGKPIRRSALASAPRGVHAARVDHHGRGRHGQPAAPHGLDVLRILLDGHRHVRPARAGHTLAERRSGGSAGGCYAHAVAAQ